MHISNQRTARKIETPHQETIYELIGKDKNSSGRHSLAIVELAPGTAFLKHYHPEAEESYYMLEGRAQIEIDGKMKLLVAGDAIVIPRNSTH